MPFRRPKIYNIVVNNHYHNDNVIDSKHHHNQIIHESGTHYQNNCPITYFKPVYKKLVTEENLCITAPIIHRTTYCSLTGTYY